VHSGTVQIFWVPPIISVTGKATDFKCGEYIYRTNPNKSPQKFGKKGARAYPEAAQIFLVPLLSQERTSNFVGPFRGSIGPKAHEKFWD